MEKDKFQELVEAKALAEQELEKMRTPVTILFTDIKGSTSYFEKKGDVAGMAMVQHHNNLLFPIIEGDGGRIVKTIGDAIMACFTDPVGAVKAAVGLQRALEADRRERAEEEHIHIRVGLHTGLGLLKDNDVFGDVVNAAARVQHQTEPDQILITDVLLDAARASGFQCANFGKAQMKGKDEPIDVYAVAWSESATEQLIDEIQAKYEARLKDAKRQYDELEEEMETARDHARAERRKLTQEIEQLEEAVERAREGARAKVSDEMQSEIRFQLEEAIRARADLEQQMQSAREKWDAERNGLKAQMASMQGSVIEAIERSNNPTRMALAVREQVDARLVDAKQEWQLQWEGDRRRLQAEIDRMKKASGAADEKKEQARRVLLEKLGKLPVGSSGGGAKSADQLQREFEDAKIGWETERDQLKLKVTKLENEMQRNSETMRAEIHADLKGQYEPRLAEANRDRQRLGEENRLLTSQLDEERQRLGSRVASLEQAIPEAQESARKQASAELQSRFDGKLEEVNRLKSRAERKQQDIAEELEAERRKTKRVVTQLEEQLKEAREAAYKAQRQSQQGSH